MDTPKRAKMTREESLARARAGARRRKEERLARELRERGWGVISPYEDAPICIETLGMAHDLMQRAYTAP